MDSRFLRHPAARRLGGPLALLLCLAGCALPGAPPPLLADSTREADAGEQDGEGDVADPGLPGAGVAIVLDGRFQDWDPVAPACPERAGDGGPSGIDLSDLRVANTPERLHLLLDTGRVLELDTDNGLSLYLECGDRDEAGGSGLRWDPGLRSGSAWGPQGTRSISHADLGFVAMPTTTGSRFEATLERASLERLLGPGCVADSLRIRVADRSSATGDQAPDGGGWIRYRFSGDLVPPRPLPSLGRTPGTLRVVSWNVLWSGIVDPALEGPFRRVLQALDPDVVALQEILEHAEARDLLQAWLPGGSWEYAGFSDRVTLSRWPRDWDWPGSFEPLESRFTVSAIVLPGGGRLAVLNAHLSFGDQDEARQREADSFAAFLREVRTPGTPSSLPPGTPFLLVGDLNLVGDRTQLETLLTGAIQDTATFGPPSPPDWDGSALADALPLVAGDAQAVTWKAPSSSYWPGRLDFVIYPDSALTLHASFVLDTGRLPPGELSAHGLEATDTAVASDHLPVIADFLLSP